MNDNFEDELKETLKMHEGFLISCILWMKENQSGGNFSKLRNDYYEIERYKKELDEQVRKLQGFIDSSNRKNPEIFRHNKKVKTWSGAIMFTSQSFILQIQNLFVELLSVNQDEVSPVKERKKEKETISVKST